VIDNYIKESREIDLLLVMQLVEDLKEGLPICSIRRNAADNIFNESPTTLPEILLAAWIFRSNELRGSILSGIRNAPDIADETNKTEFVNFYQEEIIRKFNKFDQSVLRSIQVSEWFGLFYNSPVVPKENVKVAKEDAKSHGGVLVDYEIRRLIESKEIRIIPLMNFEKQLGSSSLDVRLGTSFQLFHPTVTGSVDFTKDESSSTFDENSHLKDLDYMESITVQPGQFVLGHTMEYIKLPNTIAAEIEGRSSFARMGLEIHMTAGYIDPGFEGVVTLEIFNAGSMPVCLYPGMRIAQIRFLSVNKPLKPYNRRDDAKYKGLLLHNYTLQNKDIEIECIRKERERMNLMK